MPLPIRAALLLCCLTFSSTVLAQPVEVDRYPEPAPPVLVPGPPTLVQVPCAVRPGRHDPCLQRLLDVDPRYQAARGKRTLGIVLTSVGPAVGIIVATSAWASYISRDVSSSFCGSYGSSTCKHNDYTGEKIAAGVGVGLLVVSLAVGIPTIVSGSRDMRFIRSQYIPVPMVSVAPHQTSVGATWRF